MHITCRHAVFSVQRHTGPGSAEKKGPGCAIPSPGFHPLRSFIWNSETHGSRGVSTLSLPVCYQAALMSSLTPHRDAGSSLLLGSRSPSLPVTPARLACVSDFPGLCLVRWDYHDGLFSSQYINRTLAHKIFFI